MENRDIAAYSIWCIIVSEEGERALGLVLASSPVFKSAAASVAAKCRIHQEKRIRGEEMPIFVLEVVVVDATTAPLGCARYETGGENSRRRTEMCADTTTAALCSTVKKGALRDTQCHTRRDCSDGATDAVGDAGEEDTRSDRKGACAAEHCTATAVRDGLHRRRTRDEDAVCNRTAGARSEGKSSAAVGRRKRSECAGKEGIGR